ncbi:MAG: type II toxin-antitoxin system PemK/MazF family toxin [Rhodothermaceae bacterium]|nr:type II toxin-antitoxin system PemK/MazF family toxin [Rhodothermaceae bacterium]
MYLPGAIVLVDFPFANLSKVKKRPALVVAKVNYGDYILCQVTSKAKRDGIALIEDRDLQSGSLRRTSNIRYQVLFTASEALIDREVALLNEEKTGYIFDQIKALIAEAMSIRKKNERESKR